MKSSNISMTVVVASLVLACSGGDPKTTKRDGQEPVGVVTAAATAVSLPSPAGADLTAAIGVNDASTAAGWASTPGGSRAVSWTLAGGQPPATAGEHLPIAGNSHSAAFGVSINGMVVGESQKGTATVAVVWPGVSATPTELSLTGFSAPAVAFAAAGDRVVGQATSGGRTVAVIWTTPVAAPVELGTLDSDGTSRAYAVSASGLVVGEASDNGALRGAVWAIDGTGDVDDGPDPLPPLPGDVKSVAFGASGETIVGESEAANGTVRAVRWTRNADTTDITGPVALGAGSASSVAGPLAVGQTAQQAALWDLGAAGTATLLAPAPSQALGINALGSIVGFSGTTAFVSIAANGPATGLDLTPNPAVTSLGVPVEFTATGSGSSGYQYQFWVSTDGGVSWTIAQPYSADNTYTYPASIAGDYLVVAWVRTSSAVTFDASAIASVSVANVSGPATGLTLTPTSGTTPVGTAVEFTATGAGSSGYQYQFWLSTDGGVNWTIVQPYAADNTYTFTATTAGDYLVVAWVRTSSQVAFDASSISSMRVTAGAATGVNLTPASGATAVGAPVEFTATATGGSSGYEYQFWLSTDGGVGWTIAQPYSVDSTYTFPAATAGEHLVVVWVRTSSGVNFDVTDIASVAVGVAAATGVTITPDPTQPSPHIAGTGPVEFTATAVGGSSNYQYQFWVSIDGGLIWTIEQPYSTDATYTFDATAGDYLVAVWVRTSSEVAFDVANLVRYVVVP